MVCSAILNERVFEGPGSQIINIWVFTFHTEKYHFKIRLICDIDEAENWDVQIRRRV